MTFDKTSRDNALAIRGKLIEAQENAVRLRNLVKDADAKIKHYKWLLEESFPDLIPEDSSQF